ncbi:putative oxidoreductase [Chitinophaga sp. CF118]|uniref:DoxX family protein n=1 Tax=Chitinophaga sp. CF118 TaxID=1884367 RepID=UPI0008F13EF5|nr:DoxX family protein [Chitinophaga sp. CF118]SFE04193.1 putative oxidoreductase [Chitinophaga sp. CF118]
MRKLFSTGFTNGSVNFSLFVLRVVFGGLLVTQHGWDKLMKFSSLRYSFPDPLHIGSTASLSLTVFAEVLCSIFLVLGLLTRLAAIPLVITFGVVVFMIKGNAPVSEKELPIMYLAAFIVVLAAGPGKASVDRLMGK